LYLILPEAIEFPEGIVYRGQIASLDAANAVERAGVFLIGAGDQRMNLPAALSKADPGAATINA
jgi:hypothetical protein